MNVESREFSTAPVPDEHTVSWVRVALIASMVAFSLPVFLTGVEIAISFSPLRTLEVFVVGTVILTVIGCITAAIGTNTRLTSYMLNRIAFGSHGAALVNVAFAISLLGWFGVNIDLFSGAVQRLTVDIYAVSVPAWPIEISAGIIMTVTTVYGFRAINTLSALLIPVLIAVTAQLIVGSLTNQSLAEIMSTPSVNELSFGDGVSAVVGAAIVGAVILPDITRFVRHWSGAIFVVLTSYLVIQFIVISAGGLSATSLGDDDLLNIMLTLGISWAAFAIVMSEKMVNELGLKPIARLASYAPVGVEPKIMGMGPVSAVPKALKQAGLTLNDIEQIELNEAFASQSVAVIRELGLNPDIVNVNGGAIALGHPLGCTGAKLSVQLFDEMRRRKQKYGIVTMCVGTGQGAAGVYELIN